MTWKVDDLQILVDFLALKSPLFAPSIDGHMCLMFRQISPGEEIDLSRRTDISARNLFQPETHYYLDFGGEPGAEPVLRDFKTNGRIILGLRPCDMTGLRVFDSVFSESESFSTLRSGTIIIGYLCDRLESSCFCESVGVSPRETEGMDLFLFRTADGIYHLDSVTDRGSALMEGSPFPQDDAEPESVPLRVQPLPRLPDDLGALLLESDDVLWKKISFACVNCRICTYVCPTCHCFTISDEVFRDRVARAAVWDSCQSRTFTKEASGHNPRESRTARARQRILHKFSYYPTLNDGTFMCSGCGRCDTSCPTGRNLLEDLLALTGEVR
ncbi:hypothetical protein DRQ25_05355 [Candidatus Fermentibacteria bacterium]|nr:MAG: hypothetical protein DRQ25_05355 [Candidatus Fermentibacteria bacterium]